MTIPTDAAAIAAASNKILKGTWATQSNVDKTWLVIKIIKDVVAFPSGTHKYEYRWYAYKDNEEGYYKTNTYGSDLVGLGSELLGNASKYPKYKKAQEELKLHKTKKGPDAPAGTELDNYVSTDTPILPDSRVNIERWNPPNHSATRGLPFYVTAGIKSASQLSPSQESLLATADKYINNLGKIYQTTSSAKALNVKNVSNLKKTNGVYNITPDKIWGFRFCYNPTTITYSTSVDSSIDWMLAPSDPSKFFGGNTSVTFDLYLNRIVDMSTLRRPNYQSSYPGIDLTDAQRQGILTRGTEYDIEYLYRVVNGNPRSGTKLLSDTTAQTADYGYITGMPFWLQLHDNMIFKASLSGFSVNHVMFTENMVPMFTVVTLSFIRYPETDTTQNAKEAVTDYYNSNIKTGLTS